ncbi:hypothetical protein MMC31_001903 [Peltigera leucophlebia]|nr:hypothetical protein [Peltigera leucophlebia]
MSSLTSNPDTGTSPTSSANVKAPLSIWNIDEKTLQSIISSTEREIVPHLGFTYSWESMEDPEGIERADGYCPGGYHPTLIGDKFNNGKYIVHGKLGWGTSSTVWLAQNTLIEGEYVALKILTAEATKTTNEQKIMAHLQSRSNPDHPGYPYVASSLDWFWFSGPNGHHLCLVNEVVGCSLQMSKDYGEPNCYFPIKASRAIAAQVILGLAYLHSLGVCHGDLNLNNILLHRPFQGLTVTEIYEQYDMPYKVALVRTDNAPIGPEAPSYIVHPMRTGIPCDEVTDCQVKISDFGSAFIVGHEPEYGETTIPMTPPEVIFNQKLTLSMDIWSLGCTLYDILGSGGLFSSFFGHFHALVGCMVRALGPIPEPWWEGLKGKEGKEKLLKHRNPVDSSSSERLTLDARISRLRDPSETSEMTEAEITSLKALLSAMVVYIPSKRISSLEILSSDYMKNWAEPALVEELEKNVSSL